MTSAAQPVPDQPALVLGVFLACLALHYVMWAARSRGTKEVRRRPAPREKPPPLLLNPRRCSRPRWSG